MDRARIDGVELEYEIRGTGEPVVLMHAGVCAEWFRPLLEETHSPTAAVSSATTALATQVAVACRVR